MLPVCCLPLLICLCQIAHLQVKIRQLSKIQCIGGWEIKLHCVRVLPNALYWKPRRTASSNTIRLCRASVLKSVDSSSAICLRRSSTNPPFISSICVVLDVTWWGWRMSFAGPHSASFSTGSVSLMNSTKHRGQTNGTLIILELLNAAFRGSVLPYFSVSDSPIVYRSSNGLRCRHIVCIC